MYMAWPMKDDCVGHDEEPTELSEGAGELMLLKDLLSCGVGVVGGDGGKGLGGRQLQAFRRCQILATSSCRLQLVSPATKVQSISEPSEDSCGFILLKEPCRAFTASAAVL